MATRVLRIELTVTGIDTAERMQALTEALRAAGRDLHARATLICGDTTPPQVELSGEDLTDGRQEISIAEDTRGQ